MSTVEHEIDPLVAGDKLSRADFMRRWEAMPHIKKAELIGGIVYMPSPLSRKHASRDNRLSTWIGVYAAFTPGCEAGNNATWFMLDDAPQPDVYLWMLPPDGGQAQMEGPYPRGAPDLTAETCLSSTAYDLHQKKELYRQAGVREYVTLLLREREVRWHRRVDDNYQLIPASTEGVIRSAVFPGLWLDVQPLLDGDMQRALETLQHGLQTPEHADFVARLRNRQPG